MIKYAKILVDACMAILLVLLFPSAENPSLHVVLGFALAAAIIVHLLLNGKWLLNSIKNLFGSKLNSKTRYILMLAIGLMIAFFVCIFSGIAIYQSDYYTSGNVLAGRINPSLQSLYGLHSISSALCIIIGILHVKVHWGYIKSFVCGKNKNAKRKNS